MLPVLSRAFLLAFPVFCMVTGAACAQSGALNTCDPRIYGATNDGTTDNTVMLQKTIDDCAASGGGIVRVTGGGTYITGPISLRNHIYLQVDAGTVLKNTNDHSRYQPAFIGYPFQFKNDPAATGAGPTLPGLPEAMISAHDVTDVGIIGAGTIDGSGADPAAVATSDNPTKLSWWALAANAKAAGGTYAGYPDIPSSNGLPRPWMVEFYNATSVTVRGITLTNSPMWSLGLRYCDGVLVSNYVVRHPSDSPNTDGVDLVGSKNVVMTRLDIATGDDNVAIKSGLPGVPNGAYYAAPYNLPRVPTSNVAIVNSSFGRGHGLSIGSETVNGIHNIAGLNIRCAGTDNGFRIKTGRDRGNQIYGIVMQNLRMVDVPIPLSISEYYPTIPDPTTGDIAQTITNEPHVHDIFVSNVTATNPGTVRTTATTGGLIIGLPELPIVNLKLSHVHITSSSPTYMRLRNLMNSTCNDVTIQPINQGPPNNVSAFNDEGGLSNVTGCTALP